MADNNTALADALTVERFPMLVSTLTPRQLKYFTEALHSVAQGLRMDAIPNPVMKDAKDSVNRVLHDGHKDLLYHFFYSDYPNPAPEPVSDIIYGGILYVHLVPGRLAKLDKLDVNHPAVDKGKAFYRELLPLSQAFEILKAKVVKKNAPKPVEERKEAFQAPRASNKTVEMVFGLLKDITDQKYQEVKEAHKKWARRLLTAYMEYVASEEKPKDPYRYYARQPEERALIAALVQDNITRANPKAITVRDDVEEILEWKATKHADAVRATFLSRNLHKVAAIVDAKGNFTEAKVLHVEASADGLRGSIRFKFEDGSDFVIKKSSVWSTSIHGRHFLRFPLTFHDVTMPDGSPMKQPSEERMNLIFAGRYYGMISAPKSERIMLQSLGGVRLGAYDEDKGAFHAEATEEALRKLGDLSADFPHDLKPRSFDELAEMTTDGLAAELAWHAWAASLNDSRIYDRMHVPLEELNARVTELARAQQMEAAFSNKPTPAPSSNNPSL
ncbi:hypothetical protein [Cupriavidus sp. TMH.W2]|uniref:hypothetical protein n=1 Tax=Cupriavidus sp. TMH.W2 TaxID=3434465 RepID=UPI003D77A4CC